jgi:hypothetical protein
LRDGGSERTLCDHVEAQPNSIKGQSTDVTERTFSEHVGAQQNSTHNELDGARLASAGKYFIAYKVFLLCFPFYYHKFYAHMG